MHQKPYRNIQTYQLASYFVFLASDQVNLKYGIHHPSSNTGSESDTCTACAGTMIMEFGALSRLTGDPIFEVHFFPCFTLSLN